MLWYKSACRRQTLPSLSHLGLSWRQKFSAGHGNGCRSERDTSQHKNTRQQNRAAPVLRWDEETDTKVWTTSRSTATRQKNDTPNIYGGDKRQHTNTAECEKRVFVSSLISGLTLGECQRSIKTETSGTGSLLIWGKSFALVISSKIGRNSCRQSPFQQWAHAMRCNVRVSVPCWPLCNRYTSSHATFSLHSNTACRAKIKTSLSSLFLKKISVSGFYLCSLLYLSHSLSQPPHPFCLSFPSGTREMLALIAEILFTPAEKDGDTLQTPTPAHRHARSILAPLLMPVRTILCVCLTLLSLNFSLTPLLNNNLR